jgi:glycine cleavage system H lipoate-binding protein
VNEAAESGGWFIKLKVADESQLEGLLSPEAYAELLENEA